MDNDFILVEREDKTWRQQLSESSSTTSSHYVKLPRNPPEGSRVECWRHRTRFYMSRKLYENIRAGGKVETKRYVYQPWS